VSDFWQLKAHSDLPAISPLMFFLWSAREDLHDVFNIESAEGRECFLGWFFLQGVTELNIEHLLNDYWLNWIKEKVVLKKSLPIPRVGLLFRAFRDDIKNAFDLESQDGQQGLIDWTEAALKTEIGCQWIDNLTEQRSIQPQLGVNLIGFAFGELGIGEDVRMAAAACDKAGIPYTVVNIAPGKSVRQKDQILAGSITNEIEQLTYSTNIFCLTGFDTVHAFLEKGSELFEGRYNIGWWPWELPVWPEQWMSAFDLIDEVWAATTYTQKMYRHATDKPVTLMPLPVSVERAVPVKRKSLGLVKKQFLFLYIFDFNSYLARKNPTAVVKAFLAAFPKNDQKVGLVIKTMNSNSKNPKWKKFQTLCQKDSRIVLLEKTLDREKVLGLIDTCDAYITLHRAEGFGRTPAEAMLFGKPVVATDFSGNVDFVNNKTGFPVKWDKKSVKVGQYPFITKKSNAYWAEPCISHAAKQMQAALKSAPDKKRESEIKKFALEQFSLVRISKLMKKRLIEISSIS
jgi:glycosyltransferase involved in cell wall biosynthesis